MKEEHLINRFLEFEEKNDLFDIKIKGLPFWALIRFNIYSQIIKTKFDTASMNCSQSNITKIFNYFRNLFPCVFFHNPLLKLEKVDFLIFNHPRRVYNDGIWEEPYTDRFLQNNKNKKFYVYESAYRGEHKKNVLTPGIIKYKDILNNFATILTKIYKNISPFSNKENNILEYIKDKINNKFSINKDFKPIKYNLLYYNFYKILLRYIIIKTKPDIIYEVVYYDPINIIVNDIASEMGIKTIEFQHGTMGYYHIAYNYLKKRKYSWFPDKVYFFNKFWRENSRVPLDEENKVIYGNPYLEAMKNKYTKINKKEDKELILFLSQRTISNKLSKFAIDLNSIINSSKFKIIYKLHPSEYKDWKKRLPGLIRTNIAVIDNNNRNLYYYFSVSDYQIGVYSTAIYEGLEFNLKTFILDVYGSEYMENIISNGKAKLISYCQEFIEYIE